jgi:hypothetical protein
MSSLHGSFVPEGIVGIFCPKRVGDTRVIASADGSPLRRRRAHSA